MDNDLLELFGRCLEIHDTDGLEAAEEFCRDHPEHARELKRRLELLEGVGLLESEVEAETIPERVGEFEVLERIGGGGMGVVYRARQPSLAREVALKLVRPDHAWIDRARVRFRREVEAVANLHHPGIVPIYAVGESDGLPWFAMELIDGCTLEQAVARLRGRDPATLGGADLARAVAEASGAADVDEEPAWVFDGTWSEACSRVAVQIASALEHAHRRGVLHRDVKPANVMLTPAGRVMLVDFGVARTEHGEDMTQTGTRLGTPAYMSPEQLRGDHVDVRADVYSLGVTLHELLTLQRAFGNRSEEGLLRDIREGACPSVRSRVPGVSRDLDVVCRVAMDRDAERRYATTADLRRDLEAVLSRRPIDARTPTPLVRLGRWLQRNPTTSVAAVLGFLLVVVGPSIYAVRMREANRRTNDALSRATAENLRAEENYDRALDALGVLTESTEGMRFIPGMDGVRKRILDSVLEFHLEMIDQRADDPGARADVARSLIRVANIRRFRGRHIESLEMYDRGINEFRAILDLENSSRFRRELAAALIGRARTLAIVSRQQDATRDIEESLEILTTFEAGLLGRVKLEAEAYVELSTNERDLGDLPAARARMRDAIALLERVDAHEASTSSRKNLAQALTEYSGYGTEDAEEYADRALEILESLIETSPRDDVVRTSLAATLDRRATRQSRAGRFAEAATTQVRVIGHFEEMVADFPEVWTFRRGLAVAQLNHGITLAQLKRLPDALEFLGKAETVIQQIRRQRPGDHGIGAQLAACLIESSKVYVDLDDPASAVDALERASGLLSAALESNPKHPQWRSHMRAASVYLAEELVGFFDHEEAHAATCRFVELATTAWDYYAAARLHGSCAQLAFRDSDLDDEERDELVEEYVADSLAALERCVESGWEDLEKFETSPRLALVRRDRRFESLLERARERVTREPR